MNHLMPITENSTSRHLADKIQDFCRYDHDSCRWFQWDSSRWRLEKKDWVIEETRNACATLAAQDPMAAKNLGKSSTIKGVEFLARSDPRLAVTSDEFDRDPWLLGTPDGTVDLRTGETRESLRDDLITKATAVAPAPPGSVPERWLRFLDESCSGDADQIDYLKRVAGYCLTGLTIEHKLFFVYGPGGNGKSVLLNTSTGILGDYAVTAAMNTFTASRGDRHSADLAMLRGARLVTASETEEGQAWAESRIKQLTGGDPISANFMRGNYFTYQPQFKLVIAGNHKPALRNVDDAARRRFHLVPFVVKPKQVDKKLEQNLRDEWPAILRWMIDGCLDWQADESLGMPQSVRRETEGYFEDQDIVGQWLDDCCEVDAMPIREATQTRCLSEKLFLSFSEFCRRAGEPEGTNKALSAELMRRGFIKKRTSKGVDFVGIRIPHEQSGVEL
ncbi:MAG: phage/plasmid primase, P4 family [Pseudomonadota bacterium]